MFSQAGESLSGLFSGLVRKGLTDLGIGFSCTILRMKKDILYTVPLFSFTV